MSDDALKQSLKSCATLLPKLSTKNKRRKKRTRLTDRLPGRPSTRVSCANVHSTTTTGADLYVLIETRRLPAAQCPWKEKGLRVGGGGAVPGNLPMRGADLHAKSPVRVHVGAAPFGATREKTRRVRLLIRYRRVSWKKKKVLREARCQPARGGRCRLRSSGRNGEWWWNTSDTS